MKKLLRVLLFFNALLFVSVTFADDFTWTGATNSNWNDPANWNNTSGSGGFPDDATDNVLIDASSTVDIVLGQGRAINNITYSDRTLDLSGEQLQVVGSADFISGTIINGILLIEGNSSAPAISVTFDGTNFGQSVSTNPVTVNVTSEEVLINGGIFNGPVSIEKTGATTDNSEGGATFNSTIEIENSSSGDLILETMTKDTYQSTTTFTNSGAGEISIATGNTGSPVLGTIFNGDIIVNSTNGNGIHFGQVSGTAALTNGNTITIGGTGFSAGELRFRNFSQIGTSVQQQLFLSGSSTIVFEEGTSFQTQLTVESPGILLNGTVFENQTFLTKTGASDDDSDGGNTFQQFTIFQNNGTGRLRLSSVPGAPDDFQNFVVFGGTGSGALEVAYTNTHTFSNSFSVDKETSFGAGFTGTEEIIFGTTNFQNISGAAKAIFSTLKIDKSAISFVPISATFEITEELIFVNGVILSSVISPVIIADDAIVTGTSLNGFVHGPVQKVGDEAFVFPIGNFTFGSGPNTLKPIEISAPATTTDAFTVEFFNSPHPSAINGERDEFLGAICETEYWNINRTNGTSDVSVTMFWDAGTCTAIDRDKIRIARFDGTKWVTEGTNPDQGNSEVTTDAALSDFPAPLTFGERACVIVNTKEMLQNSFTISAPGVTPVNATSGLPTSEENICGNLPAPGTLETLLMDIPATAESKALQVKLTYDEDYQINAVTATIDGEELPIAEDYYTINTINGGIITFHRQKPEDATLNISTNLQNGTVYDPLSGDFVVTIPLEFDAATLTINRVKGNTPGQVAMDDFTDQVLSWDGTGGLSGVYEFEVLLDDGNGFSKTYKGQFIIN